MYQLERGPKINFVLSTNEPIPAKKTELKSMKIAVLYTFEPNDVMYHQFLTRSLMLMVLIWEKFV